MAQGLVSYPGVLYPKGATYTQTLGTRPDVVSLQCVPQATAIPNTGTVTFSYNGGSVTLPNCILDTARIVADTEDGFLLSLAILDRRERWKYAAPISGEYNIWRAGTQPAGKKKSLRELAGLLFTAMGEGSANVSALSNAIYPEVRWNCDPPYIVLNELLKNWGFSVSLGFGSEVPTVVQIGVGSALPTTSAMMISSTLDPKLAPQYVRTCFNDSLAQVRFLLEPIALETDDTWVALDSASYKPAGGWEIVDPNRLSAIKITGTAATYDAAIKSVMRAYRIKNFAAGETGTLDIPDGSGTLSSILQVLPLQNRLLDEESIRSDGSAIPFRLYGKRRVPIADSGMPPRTTTTSIDDEIVGEAVHFDGETGVLLFEEPQYWVNGSDQFKPAVLFLECTCKILNATTNVPAHYEKDTEIDPLGFGYHSVKYHDTEARTVVTYGASQAASGTSTNQTALDAIAAIIATSVSGQYVAEGSQMIVYAEPILSLRCDGAITQVQHVISDGTRHPGSYTVASRHAEFDRFIRTRDEQAAHLGSQLTVFERRSETALKRRKDTADD